MSEEQIKKSLDTGLSEIEKQLIDDFDFKSLDDDSGGYKGNAKGWLQSELLSLDYVMGQGMPYGRVVEIYGLEGSGKTSIALAYAAEAQRQGGIAIMYDTEQAASPERFRDLGVNTRKLMYRQTLPEKIITIEEIYNSLKIIIPAIRKKNPSAPIVIIWDSIAGTPAQQEIDGQIGDATMGIHARLHSQGLRVITQMISQTKAILVMINQVREKIASYGGGTDTPGGKAIKFYSSIRLQVKKVNDKQDGVVSVEVWAKKNKIAPPHRKTFLDIYFNSKGIDVDHSVLQFAKEIGIITGSTWLCLIDKDGAEVKFQKKSWPEIYSEHKSHIKKMITEKIKQLNEEQMR